MATKIDVEKVERRKQPDVFMDPGDPNVRSKLAGFFDERDKGYVHTWESAKNAEDAALMRRQGKEVVMEDGEPVRDTMGDVLVRHDRKQFELRKAKERRQSLLDVTASAREMDEDSAFAVDADLAQMRAPKEPTRRKLKTIELNNLPE